MKKSAKEKLKTGVTIFVSVLSLVLALVSRFDNIGFEFISSDIDYILFISLAMLIPLYKIQISNDTFIKNDIEDIQESSAEIKKLISAGVVRNCDIASIAAEEVIHKIENAEKLNVYNTYIIMQEPYTEKAGEGVKNAIKKFLTEKKGKWEETVSKLGLDRVNEIKDELGKLPKDFQVMVIREDKGDFPVCNFIILEYPQDKEKEIYFGWGYFKGNTDEQVFWSKDKELISFFKGYHKVLRGSEISESYLS